MPDFRWNLERHLMANFLRRHVPTWRIQAACTFLGLALAMISAPSLHAQSPSPAPAQAARDNSDASTSAAARKAKFDDARRRLEQGEKGSANEIPSDPNQTLFVSPAKVNMLSGESHAFCVFDIEGRDLTASAQWTLSSSGVVDLAANPDPEVTSKSPGIVILQARVQGRVAEAEINVITADKMVPGMVKWSSPQIPGYRTDKIVPAVPSARGPDVYITDRNEKGEILLRAILSDGRQLWMKKGAPESGANKTIPATNGVPIVTPPKPRP